MQLPEQKFDSLKFIPARLTEGKTEWYLSYYAYNPATEGLKRKKIKLNRVRSIAMRRTIARQMIMEINDKLKMGWSPFVEQEAPKSFHKLFEAFETYIKQVHKEGKENTIRSYVSMLKKLKEWTVKKGKQDIYVYQFTQNMASDIMLDLYADISLVTYNNNLAFFNIVFNWLKAHHYVKNNPFEGIPKKNLKKYHKTKEPISAETRKDIAKYLVLENPNYLTMMMIEFYCLVRPSDMVCLKKKHIDTVKMLIEVRAETTKSGRNTFRTIPLALMPLIRKLNLAGNQ